MRRKVESKRQVLAALALAFALGMAMIPSGVFAEETATSGENATTGGENAEAGSGNATTSDGNTTATADDNKSSAELVGSDTKGEAKETLPLDKSIVELYNRVYTRESFAGYRKAEKLVSEVYSAEIHTVANARYWVESRSLDNGTDNYLNVKSVISDATWNKIGADKYIYEVIDVLKDDPAYVSNAPYKSLVDNEVNLVEDSYEQITKELKTFFPDDATAIDEMSLIQLVEKARTVKDFGKYYDLYKSMGFLRSSVDTVNGSTAVSIEDLNKFVSETNQMLGYAEFSKAAKAIDPTVLEGLFSMPVASVGADDKTKAPDTGIVNLIETGALDLSTITLIVSAAVASVAGLGLIAKLYLKHKF